ncbi:sensor histidine kinase [Bradyrhizobium lablabi]|uniref:sensor histidine kinase n=1 Tax=Bradyrhizobium lablabi TaxID=722472 RepID=UPI001BAD9D20|nr:sensor histidine kinase [Bradyrhizobium lablabi]MBR1119906.1 sensor histidine kinase [Bradyrhizobium lablabi]
MRSDVVATMSGLSELSPEHGATERLLLREFSHRINNELASVIGLVSAAASRCRDDQARVTLTSIQDRLKNFARIHHSLQAPEYTTMVDPAAYLQQLCQAISSSMLAGEGIELLLSVHPLRMDSERCWLLGMIVFELIAGAAHHVFDGKPGAIRLEIWATDSSIECCIRDNGASTGLPPAEASLSIVEALAASLHGTVEMKRAPDGTKTIVKLPHSA